MKKTVRFAQAVLASSLFATNIASADTILAAQYDEPVPNPPLLASVTGNIEITSTGKVNATNIDGIGVDVGNITITVDANNTTSGHTAITASGVGNAINILNGAGVNTATAITVNSGSNIITSGTGSGILIGDSAASISNFGGVFGGASAIDISAGGINATITNSGAFALIQGGLVSVANAPSIFVEGVVATGGTGLTLTNTAGAVINATNANDAVQINQSFTNVINNSNSTINAANGSAINLAPSAVGVITGDIFNYGTIQTTGTGQVISISNQFNGTLNNLSGGIIQSTGAVQNVILANASFNVINNAGVIQTLGSGFGINISGNSPGTINNTGTIQTNAVSLLYNTGATSTGFNNTGTISSTAAGNATILGRAGATVNGIAVNGVGYGIVNNGIISNTGGNAAINLQTTGANIIPILQQSGTITGNVLLSSGDGGANQTVLTMSGGTVTGDITSSGLQPSTLNFNGGTVNGKVTIGDTAAGINTINIAGTTLQAVNGGTGNDTFNLSGGSFTALDGGVGLNIINVPGTFTQTGTVTNVPTINVLNNGNYIVNNSIMNALAFNINAGGNMTTNFNALNDLAATITIAANGALTVNPGSTFTVNNTLNSGNLTLQPGGTLVTAAYTQFGGASISPVVSATTNGLLQVTGNATFAANSTINPSVNSGGTFIPAGKQYVVVTATGNLIAADPTPPTLVQPQSALVFFTKTTTPGVGGNITLTLGLNPIAAVAQGDNAQSIGAAIDPLLFDGTTNPELLAVLGQLELFPDSTSLTQALLQLAPSLNYSLPASSRISMDNAFDSVQIRLEQLRGLGAISQDEEYRKIRNYELYNGVSYGDVNVIQFGTNHFSAWAKVYGTIIDQHKLDEVEGYKADAVGVSIGGDWRLTNEALVGLALSFNKVVTTDYTTAQNTLDTMSYQATFYGWFQPWESIYFDTMLAVASHKYDGLRNMQIGNFVANASSSFLGTQYGAQTDIGYAFLSPENWYISPFARFRFSYLDIGKYSEKGAGGIDLSVNNKPLDELIAGVGLRIAAKRDFISAIYVPEATATLLYDFAGAPQDIQASFLGGGGFFYVSSNRPPQIIQIYSIGVNAYTNDGYSASLKFNFEHREQLFGYNGFFQINYNWD